MAPEVAPEIVYGLDDDIENAALFTIENQSKTSRHQPRRRQPFLGPLPIDAGILSIMMVIEPPTRPKKEMTPMGAAHRHTTVNRMNAWLLERAEAYMHRKYGPRKKAVFSRLPRKVVEIGPGTGANLRYYPPGTAVTAIEPNPAMHPRLRAKADRRGIRLTIRGRKGENLGMADESAEAVVGTLVLCSVENPRQVVHEIKRILVPGGRFIFLEHVAARDGTRLNRFQSLLSRPWQWIFDGCRLNRATHSVLGNAGFSSIDMHCFMLSSPAIMVTPHIFGIAVK